MSDTTPELSDAELAELERLHGAATPPPWESGLENVYAPRDGKPGSNPVHTVAAVWRDEDRELVIAMHAALPRLVAALREARAERDVHAEARGQVGALKVRIAELNASLDAARAEADRLRGLLREAQERLDDLAYLHTERNEDAYEARARALLARIDAEIGGDRGD